MHIKEQDVRKWLDLVAERTAAQDKKVLARAPSLEKSYTALRAGAQALHTGDASRLYAYSHSVAPISRWGSWMEGVPFLHALMFNDDLIVDVLPARTEEEFVHHYKCTPRQFLNMLFHVESAGRTLYFNFRNFSPDGQQAYADSAGVMAGIFAFLEHRDFRNVYVNDVRRNALPQLFGVGDQLAACEAEITGDVLPGLIDFLQPKNHRHIMANYTQILTRGQHVPVARQALIRIVYHMVFSQICRDIPGHDGVLGPVHDLRRGRQLSPEQMAEMIFRATMLHHKYTAPLTGAYGGSYNLDEQEVRLGNEVMGAQPIGDAGAIQSQGFLDLVQGLLDGSVSTSGERLTVLRDLSAAVELRQKGAVPTDQEVQDLLYAMEDGQDLLRQKRQLKHALDQVMARKGGTRPEDEASPVASASRKDVENHLDALQSAYGKVHSRWRKIANTVALGLGRTTGGGAAAVVTTALDFPFLYDCLKALGEGIFSGTMEDGLQSVFQARDDHKQIVRLTSHLP
ncbi:MAG: hypothetical protein CMF31_07060 [Kordiimonas sp.]|nr:hypothetical protein [Kordiimonas sp.]